LQVLKLNLGWVCALTSPTEQLSRLCKDIEHCVVQGAAAAAVYSGTAASILCNSGKLGVAYVFWQALEWRQEHAI
jgi:hypothetical protein